MQSALFPCLQNAIVSKRLQIMLQCLSVILKFPRRVGRICESATLDGTSCAGTRRWLKSCLR